jgi:ABC-type Fe3+ transport system permease subunit
VDDDKIPSSETVPQAEEAGILSVMACFPALYSLMYLTEIDDSPIFALVAGILAVVLGVPAIVLAVRRRRRINLLLAVSAVVTGAVSLGILELVRV